MRSRSWNNSASAIARAIADRETSTLAVAEHFLKRCRQFDSLYPPGSMWTKKARSNMLPPVMRQMAFAAGLGVYRSA